MENAGHEVDRRKIVLGLLFCSAAGVAAWRQPTTKLDFLGSTKLEDIVPNTIGRWKFVTSSGLVVPPEDELSDSLYSQLLTRVYWDGESPPVMLLIAQSAQQTGVLQVHRPEVCYPTGGYRLSPVTQHAVPVGSSALQTNSLVARRRSDGKHITGQGLVTASPSAGPSSALTWPGRIFAGSFPTR